MISRRNLIKLAGASALSACLPTSLTAANLLNGNKKLNILFLGGTGFLGPHTVRWAVQRGHNVTLFNRGRTNPDLFKELETIKGDRNTSDIEQLRGRKWDVVIDTSAYFPRSVNSAIEALAHNIEQYVLISTTSVYTSWTIPGMDETAMLRTIPDPDVEEFRQPRTYGALKALSEQAAHKQLPGKVTVIRPGFIVGPGDNTDRFTYWPVRVKSGGEILAPGSGSDQVQFIDVRDLAEWIVYCTEQDVVGTYNAHNTHHSLTMKQLLENCVSTLASVKNNSEAKLTWVSNEFLQQNKVIALSDMPMWLPGGLLINSDHALGNGLKIRPLSQTISATSQWFSQQTTERQQQLRAGISSARESALLRTWHQQS